MNNLRNHGGGTARSIIVLVLLGITSGCALIYPKYHRPEMAIPKQWGSQLIPLQTENNLPFTAWWKQFQDPTLNHLILCGLRWNNTVGEARGHIEQAQGELLAVELSWIPSLQLLGGLAQTPMLSAPGLLFGAYPGYFAFNLFNTLARTKSAQINVEAQHDRLNATKLVLIGQIAKSYYTYIAQLERLRLLKRYIKDTHELLEIQTENYKGGLSSLIVLQETKQFEALLHIQQDLTENNIIKSQNALRYLVNQNPGGILTRARFNHVNTLYPSFGSLPVTVLAARPDVAFAEAQYRIAVQNIGIANTQLLPMVQLDHFYGHAQFSPQGTPVHGQAQFSDAYATWVIDPSVFGEIMALRGAKKVAYHAYINSVRRALRDVANDLSTHQKANESYRDIEQAYHAARTNFSLNDASYQQGIIAYQARLITQMNVDEVALQRNDIKLIQMLAIVRLYQDLGGGYQCENS